MYKIRAELDNNVEDITKVLTELKDYISEDNPPELYVSTSENDIWIKVTVDDELAGYYHLHPYSPTVLQVHTNILKPYRAHTEEITKEFKKEVIKHIPDTIDQLVCFVPEIYPNVLDYVLRNGWEIRGGIACIYKKHGMYISVDVLGITMKDFIEKVEI